jgi:hypothetical protein
LSRVRHPARGAARRSTARCGANMTPRWRIIVAGLWFLPLLLCIGIWVRSLWTLDYVHWTDQRHFPAIVSSGGRVMYTYQFWPGGAGGNDPGWKVGARPRPDRPAYFERPDADDDTRHWLLGFECSPRAGVPSSRKAFTPYRIVVPTTFVIAVPYWFLTLMTAVFSILAVRHRRRASRIHDGHCVACGYDLRASPERCPECGTTRSHNPMSTASATRVMSS